MLLVNDSLKKEVRVNTLLKKVRFFAEDPELNHL